MGDHSGHGGHMMGGGGVGMEPTTTVMNHMNHDGMGGGDSMMMEETGGHNHGGGAVIPPGTCDMIMYFHTNLTDWVLLEDLCVTSTGAMVGACAVFFCLALVYEGLKVFREQLLRKSMVNVRYHSMPISSNGHHNRETSIIETHKTVGVGLSKCDCTTESEQSIMQRAGRNQEPYEGTHIISWSHLIQTLLHMLQVVISYLLMLVFMTYNVWLCIAIILGAGAGYFAFGWKRAIVVDINEHCH